MSARPLRVVVAVVVACASTWFVARPASASPVRWRTTIDDGPSDLAADSDGVVVTSNAQSVHLLDADGRVQWRVATVDVGLGQPALGPDVVVIGGRTSITALGRADGAVRWTRAVPAPANSVAVAGSTVLVGDDTGRLAALDAVTGRERWSAQHPGALWSGARLDPDSGAVVATWHQSATPSVRVFDLASGALRWEAPTERFSAAPAVHGGRVVLAIGDGDRHARVEARDLATGDLRWQTPVPASFEEAIEPTIDDAGVAVVDHFGVVTLLDPATGRVRWQHDLAAVLVATRVVLTASRVAVTSYDGTLHVLDRRDGHVVRRLGPGRLGGLPVAMTGAGTRRDGDVLVALRLRDWGVQLRRLP